MLETMIAIAIGGMLAFFIVRQGKAKLPPPPPTVETLPPPAPPEPNPTLKARYTAGLIDGIELMTEVQTHFGRQPETRLKERGIISVGFTIQNEYHVWAEVAQIDMKRAQITKNYQIEREDHERLQEPHQDRAQRQERLPDQR